MENLKNRISVISDKLVLIPFDHCLDTNDIEKVELIFQYDSCRKTINLNLDKKNACIEFKDEELFYYVNTIDDEKYNQISNWIQNTIHEHHELEIEDGVISEVDFRYAFVRYTTKDKSIFDTKLLLIHKSKLL